MFRLSVHWVSISLPSHLCGSMTVAEHILFFSLLKGRPVAEAEEEVENMLQDLGFPHKRDELIQNLSGLTHTLACSPVLVRTFSLNITITTQCVTLKLQPKPKTKCLKLSLNPLTTL